jgi:hypothetical protein
VLRIDGVKTPDGRWREIDDAKKLIKRLCSNTHNKLKSDPPKGFKTIKNFVAANPPFMKLVGQNLRRELVPHRRKPKKKDGPTVLDVHEDDNYQPTTSKRKR